jgi:hypothetical protein
MKKQAKPLVGHMNSSALLSQLNKLVPVTARPGASVNAVFLYEDAATREWAREAHDRVLKLAGKEALRPTWWRLDNLRAPGVLAAATSTAMRADVIVVALSGIEALPLPFYTWISSWLPNRLQAGGVLAALMGRTRQAGARSGRLAKYLQEVARVAGLEFLSETRKLVTGPKRVLTIENGLFYGHGQSIGSLRAA